MSYRTTCPNIEEDIYFDHGSHLYIISFIKTSRQKVADGVPRCGFFFIVTCGCGQCCRRFEITCCRSLRPSYVTNECQPVCPSCYRHLSRYAVSVFMAEVSGIGSGKLLMALASTVILRSGSRGSHDHILLPHYSGSRAATSQRVG
jgi:hypothetical protein